MVRLKQKGEIGFLHNNSKVYKKLYGRLQEYAYINHNIKHLLLHLFTRKQYRFLRNIIRDYELRELFLEPAEGWLIQQMQQSGQIRFTQLIWEGDGRWIHISYVPSDLRCQVIE